MVFPYQTNDSGQLISMQAILGGVASANAGTPVLQVSTVNSGASLSANQSISAVLLAGTANVGFVSAMQSDAGSLMVSGKSGDASLFRVSAIGGTAGDRTLVDGTTQTISATLTPISAKPAGTVQGLVTNTFQQDASQFRVSAIQAAGVSSSGAQNFIVSGVVGDAGTFRVSGILAAGVSSVGAASFGVSAAQLDAGVLLVSAKSGTASQMVVSATQGDGSLLRVSSLGSVVTTATGGASLLSISALSGQTSANVKSTAGRLYGYHLFNPAGVDQYMQVFNVSGFPLLGTDVPTLSLGVPSLGGAVMSLGDGIGFSVGISIFATSTAAGNSIAASALRANIFYA